MKAREDEISSIFCPTNQLASGSVVGWDLQIFDWRIEKADWGGLRLFVKLER